MKTLKMSLKKSKVAIFLSALVFFLALFISQAIASDPVLRPLVNDNCCGCGLCEEIAPHNFALIDGKAEPLLGGILYPDELWEAFEQCPVDAIYFVYY